MLVGAFIGALITATVVAGAPVYLRTLEHAGVRDALHSVGGTYRNIQVSSSWVPLDRRSANSARDMVRNAEELHISGASVGNAEMIRSRPAFWGRPGQFIRRDALASRAFYVSASDVNDHVVYVDGRPPSGRIEIVDGGPVIEGAVIASRSSHHNLNPGDIVETVPEDRGIGLTRVLVTGVFAVVDPQDEYWYGLSQALLAPSPLAEGQALPLAMLIERSTMLGTIAEVNGGLPANYYWNIYVDPGYFEGVPLGEAINRLNRFEQQITLDVQRGITLTAMQSRLESLQRRMLFARIPMLLLAGLALASIAYYLFMVAGIIARRRANENSMLSSRGVNVMQIASTYGWESAIISGVPAITGPLIAMAVISMLGLLPMYESITSGGLMRVELTWQAWVWSFAAGIGVLAVLLLPAVLAAQRGIIDQRQAEARPDRPPLFQRYYLDIVFLVIGGLVWWELTSRGSIVAETRAGERTVDVTQLLSPAIFMLVVALLFLRLFPILAQIVSIVGSWITAADVAVGLRRLRRSPYWYAWPVLLLILVTGSGVVSGTLASTLARSTNEQIFYATGSDIRLVPRNPITDEMVEDVRQVPGVERVARAFRASGQAGTTDLGNQFELLAVDDTDFTDAAWFREDFATGDLAEMVKSLAVKVKPEPIHLPEGSVKVGALARSEPRVENHFLWYVLKDARGRTRTITLGQVEANWTEQTADVANPFAHPVELVSVQTFTQAGDDGSTPTTVYLDDLFAESADGRVTILEDFDTAGEWVGMPTSNGLDIHYGLSDEPSGLTLRDGMGDGTTVGRVEMSYGNDQGVRGVYRTATGRPLPVLASEGFLAENLVEIGSEMIIRANGGFVPVEIVGVLRYFPTLDPERRPFLLSNVDSTLAFLELRGLTIRNATELFVSVDLNQNPDVLQDVRSAVGIGSVTSRAALLLDSSVDPIVVAGWRGMSGVAVVMAGVAAGFGYFTYLVAHARRTRRESAYLQSMGMPARAFARLIIIEHLVVAFFGIAVGVGSGLFVSRIAINSMTFTQTGGRLLPPFVLDTNWIPIGFLAALVGTVIVVAIVNILIDYRRMPIHSLTRTSG